MNFVILLACWYFDLSPIACVADWINKRAKADADADTDADADADARLLRAVIRGNMVGTSSYVENLCRK